MIIVDIEIPGERAGEARDIDEEVILPESEKNEIHLAVRTNKRNPNGFTFSIEDGDEVLSIRLSVENTKFLLRHIIDDL